MYNADCSRCVCIHVPGVLSVSVTMESHLDPRRELRTVRLMFDLEIVYVLCRQIGALGLGLLYLFVLSKYSERVEYSGLGLLSYLYRRITDTRLLSTLSYRVAYYANISYFIVIQLHCTPRVIEIEIKILERNRVE